MKILLTGASGMVGQNIKDHFMFEEFDFLTPTKKELNLLNPNQIFSYLEAHSPQVVLHAAGLVGGIGANMAHQYDMLFQNLQMTLTLLDISKRLEIKNFVNIGSSCMYPADASNPLDEESLLTGKFESTNQGFAAAKMSSMIACQLINNELEDYNYKTLVPCNLFGKYDNYDALNSHMIPSVILKVHSAKKDNQDSIDVWGDGLSRREYMLASDFADFIFYSLPKLEELPSVTNIGVGEDFSINDYYSMIMKAINYQGNIKHDLSKPTGIKQKLLNIQKLEDFGWKSSTSIQDGIKKTYEYFLNDEN
tara:strand:- start:2785 stop:3705 length:921 start_codon:yes stop_codon:yes gene_type:complete